MRTSRLSPEVVFRLSSVGAPLLCSRRAGLLRSVAMGDPHRDGSQEDHLDHTLQSYGSSQPTTRLPAGHGDSSQFIALAAPLIIGSGALIAWRERNLAQIKKREAAAET